MQDFTIFTNLHERDVLQFIYNRTCMWNKEWEIIPLRHFMEGVREKSGVIVAAPVAMGEPKLLESLRSLEGKGFIKVKRTPRQPSLYKITDSEEIDLDHALDYMRMFQTKDFMSNFGKLGKRQIQEITQNRR